MGYFTIMLPGNRQAGVRYGTVRKIQFRISDLLRLRKTQHEKKRGYIVNVDAGAGAHNTYRMFKTMEGEWLPQEENKTTTTIKAAIDAYEKGKQQGV